MTTPLDITDFVYNTGTLTIAPGDTTAVFSGTSLSANIKNGDYLLAGGSLAVIETVTDDTHVDLFTTWAGSSITAGTYVILKASMLRNNAVQIGYDTAAFLAFLDNTTIWYVVEGAAPDPSVGEDGNRALKTNVTPWKQWFKTGGVWVEQSGSPGGPGATIIEQTTEPDTNHPDNSLWIDSDSADLDVYALTGSPPAWADTGINLKGATGPASWAAPAAWVTGTAYVAAPPASAVTQGGETYVCLVPHTSGTFATDLAAGKWIKVAAKGADGTGTGDVVGPSSAVDSHIVLFDTTSGKAIKDSGLAVSDLATAAQGAKADSAVQDVAAVTHAATSKATPDDADELPLVDSAASNVLKKLTWANLKATLAVWLVSAGWVREKLTANRTYYVRTDGSDSNNGLANTSGGAFLTIQKAIDTVAMLDCSIYDVSISVAAGTYAPITLKTILGSGKVTITGDTTTPSNVVLSSTGVDGVSGSNVLGRYKIEGLKFTNATSGSHIKIFNTYLELGANEYGAAVTAHIWVEQNGYVEFTTNFTISGGATRHLFSTNGGIIVCNIKTVTITGAPAFSTAFVVGSRTGAFNLAGNTYSGSATGTRYVVSYNAVIDVAAAGATYLPGNATGSATSGGQYA